MLMTYAEAFDYSMRQLREMESEALSLRGIVPQPTLAEMLSSIEVARQDILDGFFA